MIALIAHYWLGLLLAALIGLATAWWTWGSRPRIVADDPVYDDAPIDWPPREAAPVEAPPPAWAPADHDGDAEITDAPPIEPAAAAPRAFAAGRTTDDLMMIKGIGPQIDALLRSLGFERFEQIAGWMPEDIERVDASLGEFKGRIIRDEWIAQARLLAAGDLAAFNQRYGHL